MTIGERIRIRREELGLSQDELAKKIGYKSRSSINKIELDQYSLKQSKIKAIADALQTTPSYIMGWKEDDDQKKQKQICDLLEQCYGKDAHQMVQVFLKLDHTDQLVIYGEMLGMLKADKYAVKKESSEQKAM